MKFPQHSLAAGNQSIQSKEGNGKGESARGAYARCWRRRNRPASSTAKDVRASQIAPRLAGGLPPVSGNVSGGSGVAVGSATTGVGVAVSWGDGGAAVGTGVSVAGIGVGGMGVGGTGVSVAGIGVGGSAVGGVKATDGPACAVVVFPTSRTRAIIKAHQTQSDPHPCGVWTFHRLRSPLKIKHPPGQRNTLDQRMQSYVLKM